MQIEKYKGCVYSNLMGHLPKCNAEAKIEANS